jgi:Tol biopolymer transport system component
MNADGPDQTRLTSFDHDRDADSPQFSPDGSTIVFASAFQIWTIGADGSNPQLLAAEEDNFSPSTRLMGRRSCSPATGTLDSRMCT